MRARLTVVLLGALSVLLFAETAQAQVIFANRGAFGFGGRIQPVSFGAFPNYYWGGASPWGYGYGMPWGGYGPYLSGWGYGGSPAAWYAAPAYLPGWATSTTTVSPRTRPTLWPAVAVPPEKVREALDRGDKARTSATMEMTLASENAEVWFDDVKTTQTGRVREFVTPALDVGSEYEYMVRVRWSDGGKVRETSRPVSVRSGDYLRLDFSKSPL